MYDELRHAVRSAADRGEVRAAVAGVYADLHRAIDARQPRCDASGRCCRFDEYGHRLYVTTIELAAFMADLAAVSGRRPAKVDVGLAPKLKVLGGDAGGGACTFQVDGLCSVHPIRPFGCRMFFCDESATEWQNEQYEQLHARLKRLHEELDVPYFYVEWRAAVAALGLTGADRQSA